MNGNKAKSVCIITPSYAVSNPRTAKEADALHQAGFNVRVVYSQGNLEDIRKLDELYLKGKQWRWDSVKWSPFRERERMLYLKSYLRHNIYERFPSFLLRFGGLAEYGEGRMYKELAELAASEKADIYIGHYPTGLAAAAFAAFRWQAKFAYDMEDFYAEEKIPSLQKKRIETIERRYLPYCSYVTIASELFADEIVRRYKIPPPLIVHNVFPWAARENIDNKIKDIRKDGLSLYWFSQVIGEHRGIEDAIKAAGLLKDKVQIHMRGTVYGTMRRKILALAHKCGVKDAIYFHPPAVPEELLSRTAEHDVGLALEEPLCCLNRNLSISNKIFLYLLAGLAIAASDTLGQRNVVSSCPDAGFIYKSGDYRSLADNLNRLIQDPVRLRRCKEASLTAAHERWNWERESEKFVEKLKNILEVGR
ncbi:MAG: hypothetical protein A2Z72_05820 [Omnitrophica bacterium RBG_13_46_9]|nr:MAG: hypothetical protein A2Z72_05820 [Omnitrophica bacterium RBG_13_46_9]